MGAGILPPKPTKVDERLHISYLHDIGLSEQAAEDSLFSHILPRNRNQTHTLSSYD